MNIPVTQTDALLKGIAALVDGFGGIGDMTAMVNGLGDLKTAVEALKDEVELMTAALGEVLEVKLVDDAGSPITSQNPLPVEEQGA